MPVVRCSDQRNMTLEEFYNDLAENSTGAFAAAGKHMLTLLAQINEMFKQTTLWGLTSHSNLILLPEDNWDSGWLVAIGNFVDEYSIEYLLPKEKQPWPNATITGKTKSIDDARKYLIIAMNGSKAWEGNPELEQLKKEYGIEDTAF